MTPEGGNPPRRVRVTSPRTTAGRQRRVNVTSEIDAQTRLGELYMSTLLRAQLRLAVTVILVVLVVVGGLPLSYLLFPGLDDVRVLGMPLAWVLLGFAAYPFLLLLGWFYVRAAERNERDFADTVERS
jgi:putative solute:sodium symporter small subunit